MKQQFRSFGLIIGGLLVLPGAAEATTYKVSSNTGICGASPSCVQVTTIGAALAQVSSGDEVQIYQGTYNETLYLESDFPEIPIYRAPDATGEVIISAGTGACTSNQAPVIRIEGDQGPGLVLAGLTIQNGCGVEGSLVGLTSGKYFGGGLFIAGAAPMLEDLVITGANVTSGGGVYLNRSSATLRNVRISSNKASTGGAGIFVNQGSFPVIEDSLIQSNGVPTGTATTRGGGIFVAGGATLTLQGVSIRGNRAQYGAGIYAISGAAVHATGTLISGNIGTATTTSGTPPGGAGVYLYDGASGLFSNVTIADNTSAATVLDGVDLYSMGGYVRAENTVISNSVSSEAGKSLLYGYDMPSSSARPGNAGLEGSWFNLFASSGSLYGGSYATDTVVVSNGMNVDPLYIGGSTPGSLSNSYELSASSTLINAGNPAPAYNDEDGSRNDIGAFGGPLGLVELPTTFNDSDNDGMSDVWEQHYFSNTTSRDGSADSDSDGLTDLEEYQSGTNPTRTDTDLDGWTDGQESLQGSDPLDGSDHAPSLEVSRDQIVVTGTEAAALTATAVDPDGTALTYAWSLVSAPTGSAVSISGTTSSLSFTPDLAGAYEIAVSVTDTATAPAATTATAYASMRVYAGSEVLFSGGGTALQAAIAAATEYQTITVPVGSYFGNYDFLGKTIRLRSTNGASNTTLYNTAGGTIVKFVKGEKPAATLDGFTIANGTGSTISSLVVGGGILIDSSAPTLKNLRIITNRAQFGGGIAIMNGAPSLSDVVLDSNYINGTASTTGAGAGIYVYGGRVLLDRVNLLNNSRVSDTDKVNGGGLFAYGAEVYYRGESSSSKALIQGNRADNGSGIYATAGGNIRMSNLSFSNNKAGQYGGALYATSHTTLSLTNSSMTSNSSAFQGGAIFLSTAYLTIANSDIGATGGGNSSDQAGAIITASGAGLTAINSSFRANTATSRAGGILLGAAYLTGVMPNTFENCVFEDNAISGTPSTNGNGGAVVLANNAVATFKRTQFIDNSAYTQGGALYLDTGETVLLENCLFSFNDASSGGAIYNGGGTATIQNNTMAANGATTLGKTVGTEGGTTSINSSIIAYATGAAASAIQTSSGTVTLSYVGLFSNTSDYNGTPTTVGLVNADPRFTSFNASAPDSTTQNYRLRYSSTYINAGDPSAALNDKDGTRNDLGWDGGPGGVLIDYDVDNDGLSYEQEADFGTDDSLADTDFDGLSDLIEFNTLTAGNNADTDSDGLCDGAIAVTDVCVVGEDLDGDGVLDAAESDPRDADSDDDGATDLAEQTGGSNPRDADSDDDGLQDGGEYTAGTDPNDTDTDNDSVLDGPEVTGGTNPLDPDTDNDGLCDGNATVSSVCIPGEDMDGDGVVDPTETSPTSADTDADGVSDPTEITDPSMDPLDPADNRATAVGSFDLACAINIPCYVESLTSSDPNKDVLSYEWSFTSVPSGATAPIVTGGARASFTATVAGTYTVQLRVNDGKAYSLPDTITVFMRTPITVATTGGDYSTIQSALTAVGAGTHGTYPAVVVKSGTWRERLTIPAVAFSLIGEQGARETIIDADTDANGTGNGQAVAFNGVPQGMIMRGFTIRNGYAVTTAGLGGGIYLKNSSARIEDCWIRSNTAYRGGGVYVDGGAPELIRNRIMHNYSFNAGTQPNGGGMYMTAVTGGYVMNNHFTKNTSANSAGAIYVTGSTFKSYHNSFAGNVAPGGVSSMYVINSTLEIRNHLHVNESTSVGGVYVTNSLGTTIKNSVFYNIRGYTVSGTYGNSASFSTDNRTTDPKVVVFTSGVSNTSLKDDLRFLSGSSATDYGTTFGDYFFAWRDLDGTLPDSGAFGGPFSEPRKRSNRIYQSGGTTDDYSTIALGIKSLQTGDEALVNAGTYNEAIDFGGRSFALYGVSGAASTILDGAGKNTAVVFMGRGETSQALLSGLTIRNGTGFLAGSYRYGGGIFIGNSSPVVEYCIVENNSAYGGGGLYIANSSTEVRNTLVRNNLATLAGGGIYFAGTGTPSLVQSWILDNDSSGTGGGIRVDNASADILNTLVQGNQAVSYAGGIMTFQASVDLMNLAIVENDAGTNLGGGLYLNGGSSTLRNSFVGYNYDRGVVTSGTHYLRHSNLYQNEGADWWNYGGSQTRDHLISVDPGFTSYSKDGVTSDNYHLLESSLMIDAGDPSYADTASGGLGSLEISDIGLYGGPDGGAF